MRSTTFVAPIAALALAVVSSASAHDRDDGHDHEDLELEAGGFTFRPSLEVRLRGEYRRNPTASGGFDPGSDAVHFDGDSGGTLGEPFQDQWFAAERSRLGLGVEKGAVGAQITLQDARALGSDDTAGGALPSFGPYEAYLEVHDKRDRSYVFRLGRQVVEWGDGRLLGDDADSPTGRSLDAARGMVRVGDFDFEALAVLLEAPGAEPEEVTGSNAPRQEGSGAQLYGLDAKYHLLPLLSFELAALARFVRPPTSTNSTPGDTYVVDARVFGDYRGFRYALEGAYQAGRVASFGENRSVGAAAIAGRVEWETSLWWHLTLGAEGAYASGAGSENGPTDDQARFDPILPDTYQNHGQMRVFGWSNLIEAGGNVAVRPTDALRARLDYRYVGLAEADGRWTDGSLVPVGQDPTNDASTIGHAFELGLRYVPVPMLRMGVGYGLLLLGDGGKNILAASGRGDPDTSHWAMLQTEVVVH